MNIKQYHTPLILIFIASMLILTSCNEIKKKDENNVSSKSTYSVTFHSDKKTKETYKEVKNIIRSFGYIPEYDFISNKYNKNLPKVNYKAPAKSGFYGYSYRKLGNSGYEYNLSMTIETVMNKSTSYNFNFHLRKYSPTRYRYDITKMTSRSIKNLEAMFSKIEKYLE